MKARVSLSDDQTLMATLLIGLAVAGAALVATTIPNHDVSWLWLATERFLNGATLGNGIWEPNPPLIFWIMSPAVIGARLAKIDYHLAYTLYITGLATASAFAGAGIARPLFTGTIRSTVFACALLACLLFLPGDSFGQREHILVILIAPYLIWETCALDRSDPRSLGPTVAISLAAACGVLLKPPLALLVVGFVTLRMVQARSIRVLIRPGYLTMLACAFIYSLTIIIFYPEWLAMTRVTAIVYSAYNPPLSQLAYVSAPFIALTVLAFIFVAPHASWRARFESPTGGMLLASALLLLGAILQLKGWTYHRLPSGVAFVLAALIFLLTSPAPVRSGPTLKAAFGLLFFLAVRPFGSSTWFERSDPVDPEIAHLIKLADNRPIAAFSTVLQSVFPALTEANVIWGSRFPCQWLIPAVVKLASGDAEDRRAAGHVRYLAAGFVAADIARYRPAVIALRVRNDPFLPNGFDWAGFYSVHPGFRSVWRDYCPSMPTPSWLIYTRCDNPTAALTLPIVSARLR